MKRAEIYKAARKLATHLVQGAQLGSKAEPLLAEALTICIMDKIDDAQFQIDARGPGGESADIGDNIEITGKKA